MNKISIVTDSSAQLSLEEIKVLGIHILPVSILIDGKTYIDGIDIGKVEFMELMEKSTSLPKTSQPALGKFIELYDELGKDGGEVISIHMTESFSGTVDAARQAAKMTETKVTVIDSTFTDRGLSFQVIEAAKLALNGVEESIILDEIERIKQYTRLFICIRTLDNLIKGGRISRVMGAVSHMMDIKLMLEMVDGSLETRVKCRGMKSITKFNQSVREKIVKTKNLAEISFSYAGDFDYANELKESFQQLLPDIPMTISHTSPGVATHTGTGAFSIIYYEK
ncbi:MAG: DegV family protein [Carnobacterium sp.]|uniref:DegV family protein n=1 Tax=Carnobacterium sp. TaxID=48221 RepID=UPI003C7599DE